MQRKQTFGGCLSEQGGTGSLRMSDQTRSRAHKRPPKPTPSLTHFFRAAVQAYYQGRATRDGRAGGEGRVSHVRPFCGKSSSLSLFWRCRAKRSAQASSRLDPPRNSDGALCGQMGPRRTAARRRPRAPWLSDDILVARWMEPKSRGSSSVLDTTSHFVSPARFRTQTVRLPKVPGRENKPSHLQTIQGGFHRSFCSGGHVMTTQIVLTTRQNKEPIELDCCARE